MRNLLMLIVGVFLVTFAWGWVLQVYQGHMDTRSYTAYYWHEVNNRIHRYIEKAEMIIDKVKKPLPARKEFEL